VKNKGRDRPTEGETAHASPPPAATPIDGAKVTVQVQWKGQEFGAKGLLPPEDALHHRVDQLLFRTTTTVRRELVKQQYGDDAPGLRASPIRTPDQMWFCVQNYVAQHSQTFFKLVPPDRFSPQWRAWFCTYRSSGSLDLPLHEPLGLGSNMWVAIENLLRAVEGTEVIENG
jgi:hypothetical protein